MPGKCWTWQDRKRGDDRRMLFCAFRLYSGKPYGILILPERYPRAKEDEEPMEEFRQIMETFAASGWELIAVPAQAWLEGRSDPAALTAALQQADKECGSCGCRLDPLYKRALALIAEGEAAL